ncbi:MAG TPA: class I SAM-dependent methyltransferase, partial [Planctomycetota bacterium]|nr:class I SAM-dependent methyltransferase [Planctomycetota bacterium]
LSRRPGITLVDATAGLGRDAFRLASLGVRVTAIERSPVVAALLADGLRRAVAGPATAAAAARRLELLGGDSRELLRRLPPPDVVLVDPMYPASRKAAAPGKELALLRRLLGADADSGELLAAARDVALRRVVVKRRAHDPPLDGIRPDLSVSGRSTRFDVYLAAHRGN